MNKTAQTNRLINNQFIKRFCARDVTLWTEKDAEMEEVAHRLDWLDAAHSGGNIIQLAETLLDGLVSEGYSYAVVLGMGGSSLAPEVFSEIFHNLEHKRINGLELTILDTTDPLQIQAKRSELPIEKTLFIVSSKSGGTAEVNALEAYFWNEFKKSGIGKPGSHFIAITDPSSSLERKGKEKGYRQVILANPNVGGRYSALIEFGLVPAVLMGIDCKKLLAKAQTVEMPCENQNSNSENPGLILGGFLAENYKAGKDKLTLIADPELASFGSWIEQLIAESSGKDNSGILPIDLEPLRESQSYGEDRIFIYYSFDGRHDTFLESLTKSGFPALTFNIRDPYDIGAEFLRWEIATAVACALIGVNAFDQPNVQLSKAITQQMISEIQKNSRLNGENPFFDSGEIEIFGKFEVPDKPVNISGFLARFLGKVQHGDFVAINAFVSRNAENLANMQQLRKTIAEKTNAATTLGFGPRFLHSTGQLHKGGKNNGHFLIVTSERDKDIEIPGEGMNFGTLQIAQAIGDMRALEQQNRHVLRLHIKKGDSVLTELSKLVI